MWPLCPLLAPQARFKVSRDPGILPQSKPPVVQAAAASSHLALGRRRFAVGRQLQGLLVGYTRLLHV